MAETIIKEWCPKCDTVNFVNNGDMEDISGIDIDGIECYSCGHEWLFPGQEDVVGIGAGWSNIEKGIRKEEL